MKFLPNYKQFVSGNIYSLLNSKSNNFGFLRFFFALSVMYYHTFILGNFGKEPLAQFLKSQESVGSLAVIGFFIISGFLVTQSLFFSSSIGVFAMKRGLRLLPAFWVCLLVTAFLFAPIIYSKENHTLNGFLNHTKDSPFSYIKNNFFLLMHQYSIAGLLKNNPLKDVFDGSLWTLFLEAKAYILLGFLGLFVIKKNKRSLIVLLFLGLWSLLLFHTPTHDASNKFLRLLIDKSFLVYATYFFAGVICYLYQKEIPFNKGLFSLMVFVTVIAIFFNFLHQILPITAPYILLWLAYMLPFQAFTKFGDFSYGIYIYAFPVQQLVTSFHYNKNPFTYFFLCFCITFILAFLSWNFIEKPALQLKNIFVRKI